MSDVNKLMKDAEQQLVEHKAWLADEIRKIPADLGMEGGKQLLLAQVEMVRLRVVKAHAGTVSVVWEYQDELAAFLVSETTPKHLRDTLAGGHVVDTEKAASTLQRVS